MELILTHIGSIQVFEFASLSNKALCTPRKEKTCSKTNASNIFTENLLPSHRVCNIFLRQADLYHWKYYTKIIYY
jgi:hypothetical protein